MIDQIGIELLDNGLHDILHFPWIISVVRRHLSKSVDDHALITATLQVILDLIEPGYVVAGYVARNENDLLYVRSWDLSPSETVERIGRDWKELGRPPNPGDVVWLELTESGRTKIHSISNLAADERQLVEQVVARRRPELRQRVSVIGQMKLNWKERQAFHDALSEELSAVGAKEAPSAEEAEYVRAIKSLVDRALVF